MNDFKLYRWWKGGRWYFYKLGKDTPWINLFSLWTQISPKYIDMNFCTLLLIKDYTKKK